MTRTTDDLLRLWLTDQARYFLNYAEEVAIELGEQALSVPAIVATFTLAPAPHVGSLLWAHQQHSDEFCPPHEPLTPYLPMAHLVPPKLRLAPETRELLKRAIRCAQACGRGWVGTGDLLGALMDDPYVGAAKFREELSVEYGDGARWVQAFPQELGGEKQVRVPERSGGPGRSRGPAA